MESDLKLSGLAAAVKAFERSLVFYDTREREQASEEEKENLRAAVIKAFEFTYELSWKAIKRWVELNVDPVVDGVPRREIFRFGAEHFLIDDVNEWMEFHQARNLAAHTYSGDMAEDVLKLAHRFLPYAQDCLKRLEERS